VTMAEAAADVHAPHRTPDAGAAALPMIGFGEVRHSRLRPVRNAFAYPGYFLMLPMRAMQDPAHPAARTPLARNRRAALSFFDTDHGDGRPLSHGGALAWLDELLRANGIDDATGEVWLHCYPRVLGYAFKPVSFWFCHRAAHDQDGALRAIVCEVNNSASATATCSTGPAGAGAWTRPSSSTSRHSCASRDATTSASCARAGPRASAASRASTTTMTRARYCRPVSAARWCRYRRSPCAEPCGAIRR